MGQLPNKVTCSERVRMNAVAGLMFVAAGDAIILYALLADKNGTLSTVITGLCGMVGVFMGIYYMCCFLNKKITVTDEGVYYTNWMGRKSSYTWNNVIAEHRTGRNAKFYFILNGKRVSFYGYANNAALLHQWLLEHERYDNDTMRAERKAAEQEEERVRQMQRKARASADDWDDDDDSFD